MLRAAADTLTEAYGRWAQTGEKKSRITFYFPMFRAGVVNGFNRVQATVARSDLGDEFTAQSRADFFDAEWNLLLTVSSEGKGTKLETSDQR